MIIAATGHRPDKLGGYGHLVFGHLVTLASRYLTQHPVPVTEVISGMAQGWDTAVATAALEHGIPLLCAIPFEGQEERWPEFAQERYFEIRDRANAVKVVCEGSYAPWKLQARNEWMVDYCDKLVALWNGSDGGTANCIRYAQAKQRPYDNLWSLFA